jgi:type IV pilus assembly protein PilM
MLRRTYVGLEIRQHELRAVAVQRRRKKLVLIGGQVVPLSDAVLQPAFNVANVLAPERFVVALNELLDPLAKRENRIAVSLPDRSGQIFLLELETPFKHRTEGIELLRWHLKDKLPAQPKRLALDFQVLEENESGHKKLLAAVIDQDVLSQYESLLEQAGYAATIIDFHSLALYSAYRTKIDLGQDFTLVGVDGCQLSILVFVNRMLDFYRAREISREPRKVFQELSRSLVNYRSKQPAFSRMAVYLHSDWQDQDSLFAAVSSAFDQEVQWLLSPVAKLMNGHQSAFSAADAKGMAAALGVAERMIERVAL